MSNRNVNKYVIYTRKSTEAEDRQILSNESQLAELNNVVKRDKLFVTDTLQESMSAKRIGRPIFNSIIKRIEKGEVNSLLVWNPDRLSRNSMDAGKLIYLLDTELLKEIRTPFQTFQNTPNDKFLLGILWNTAKLDNDNKGVNVKRGLKTKLEKGWYPFVAPHGYLNTPDRNKGDKRIVKDKQRFNLVRKMWDLLLTGNYTVPQIVEIAEKELGYHSLKRRRMGGTPISRSGMYDLFTNPFYYGEYEVKGVWYKGAHEPMVTRAEFDKVQSILGRGGKPRPQKHISPYTGYIYCSKCGSAITYTKKIKTYKGTGKSVSYEYLHCTHKKSPRSNPCHEKPSTVENAEERVKEAFRKLGTYKEFFKWALEYLRKTNQIEINDRMEISKSLNDKKEQFQRMLSRLLDALLAETITREEYNAKKSQIEAEIALVDEKLIGLDEGGSKWLSDVEDSFDIAVTALEKFNNGSQADQKFLLNKIGSNFLLNEGKLLFDLKKPYFVTKKEENGEYEKINRLELQNYANSAIKSGVSVPENLIWLGTADILLHQRLDLDYSLEELQMVFSRLNIPAPVFV